MKNIINLEETYVTPDTLEECEKLLSQIDTAHCFYLDLSVAFEKRWDEVRDIYMSTKYEESEDEDD